jgi:Flp pilus assembly pilin Flp
VKISNKQLAKKSLLRNAECGASAIEYALLLACLVLVLVTGLSSFGGKISDSMKGVFDKVEKQFSGE